MDSSGKSWSVAIVTPYASRAARVIQLFLASSGQLSCEQLRRLGNKWMLIGVPGPAVRTKETIRSPPALITSHLPLESLRPADTGVVGHSRSSKRAIIQRCIVIAPVMPRKNARVRDCVCWQMTLSLVVFIPFAPTSRSVVRTIRATTSPFRDGCDILPLTVDSLPELVAKLVYRAK